MRHLVAAVLSLGFAYVVSRTALTHTGLQFIGPLIVMLGVHFVATPKVAGFAAHVWRDGAVTAVLLTVGLMIATVVAPSPAYADAGEVVGTVLMVLFCVAIIAAVAALLAFIGWILIKLIMGIITMFRGEGPKGRMFDAVSMVLGVCVLVGACLEGVVFGQTGVQTAVASRTVAAAEEKVWDTMQTATSAAQALPSLLQNFPQPTNVRVDEGTGIGANRVVGFAGREGAGELHLRVSATSTRHATFAVQSDTTPFAMWTRFDALTYRTRPTDGGTILSVELVFERRLAPAIVFDPMMQAAARLAVGVLADDVKTRSEG